MLEHSFPREPLQRTDTDRAKMDQDGPKPNLFNLTASQPAPWWTGCEVSYHVYGHFVLFFDLSYLSFSLVT